MDKESDNMDFVSVSNQNICWRILLSRQNYSTETFRPPLFSVQLPSSLKAASTNS